MPLKRKVHDIMVPLADYATTAPEKLLKDAVLEMRKIYCEVETGECTEAGHRTSLVLNDSGTLIGIIDFRVILKTLIPEIAGGIGEKLSAIGVSIAFAEADVPDLDESEASFRERVIKFSETKVEDMMLKIRGKGIQAEDRLIDALKTMYRLKVMVLPVYDGEELVGVLRDSDLFLATANILTD
ncbi:MAG: CBS domain-containing protein [Desulfobacterales bacterium]|nr:CBS domain-containing protein [Deltaproteobacteria bacterium]NNK96003.1 CBS domain-containing protein [Desulfobacterales bacterium]